MNKDSVIDYLSYILFKFTGFCVRYLPVRFSFFLGRRLGDLLFYLDPRHKSVAYSNIRKAIGASLSLSEINKLTREFYRNFGQILLEIFLIPIFDKEYIKKYVSFEGMENIAKGFEKGKGVIFLGVHEGSWELANIISASLGFPFSVLVRDQKRYRRMEKLLNSYRVQKGCRIIQRENQTRQLIEVLKKNEGIGMSVDQGGKGGVLVKFFGKNASMSTGAVKLALKDGVTIVPTFFTRIKGPYIKIIIEPPFEIKESADRQKDTKDNLQRLIAIFEKYIRQYPKEYLWSYRIWKYSDEKNVLILNDGKIGHLRQSQAVANAACAYFSEKGVSVNTQAIEVEFKSNFDRQAMLLSSCLSGKYNCQGCLWCLRRFLTKETQESLLNFRPDVIISCGASVAPVNFVLSRENLAKSITVMRPSILSTKRFDLAVIPQHDCFPKRKNIVVTEGALNLIDEQYLKVQSQKLAQNLKLKTQGLYIGLLIGGDTKDFGLTKNTISEVIRQLKSVCQLLDAEILVTTSRRTSSEVENIVKEEFGNYSRCRLLVIANEKNIQEAVGGILGLSQIIIASPESISMISEAASSKKYVFVFDAAGLSARHKYFLEHFAKNKYIYLIEKPENTCERIGEIWESKPPISVLLDKLLVKEAIEKIM